MLSRINEKGQALMMVLFCSVVAFLFVMAMLYMVQRGTTMTGMEKRYQTSLEAAAAGMTVAVELLNNKSVSLSDSAAFESALNVGVTPGSCLEQKINFPTPDWNTSICTANHRSLTVIDPVTNDPVEPDITFTVKGTASSEGIVPVYDVYAKIIDSRKGVTGAPPGNLQTGGVVNSDGAITPVELPYFYYTVEVAARARNREEAALLTFIYAD